MPTVCLKCELPRPKQDKWCSACGERLVHENIIIWIFRAIFWAVGEGVSALGKLIVRGTLTLLLILFYLGLAVLGLVVVAAVVKWAFEELAR